MATIHLQQVTKRFGESYAVKPIDLHIADGSFVVLLGPSGCGKTTTLRMISGLEAVTDGIITFDGEDVTWRHPSERDIAFVFQFFALYPHLSCRENIAFPLHARGVSRSEVERRVEEVAKLLRIEALLPARPGSLSGGDQQRIALARALVRQPAAYLMDEPLGALDAEFRDAMRAEIKRLHLEQNATTVYVTHDQVEAMAMGDKIVVMSAAEIQQAGTPLEVYNHPANLFVARFIGSPGMNLLTGRYQQGHVSFGDDLRYQVPPAWRSSLDASVNEGEVVVGFRPEAVRLGAEGALASGVLATALHGGYSMLHLELQGQVVHARSERQRLPAAGERLAFDIDPDQVRFFEPSSERAIAQAAR